MIYQSILVHFLKDLSDAKQPSSSLLVDQQQNMDLRLDETKQGYNAE